MTQRVCSVSRQRSRSSRSRGFTLIELMIALAVLAILVTLAVPSFNDAALSSKLTGFSNDLVASAQVARSEAIKRNAPITLCAVASTLPSESGCATATSGWEVGWIIKTDTSVIQRHPPLPTGFLLRQTGGTSALTFPADVVGTTAATFTVCRATPIGKQKRTVRVTASGGTSVARVDGATTCP